MSMQRTRARYRRIPATMRRMPGGRSGGTGGGGQSSGGVEALVGLSNFSAANFLQTAAGGGEAGVGTGFGVAALCQLLAVPTAGQPVNYFLSGSGHRVYTDATGLRWCCVDGTGTAIYTPARLYSQGDVGKLVVIVGSLSGSAMRQLLRRDDTLSDTAIVGYTPPIPGTVLQLGVNSTPYAIFGAVAFRGQPTLSQLHALYDAIRTRGDLPDTMDGATITHRWSLRDELRGTIVVDGQTAPAQLTDTVTRAPVDALVRQGSPVVRVIDQSADGRRTLGAQGFSASNYLTASWQEAPSAAALGFWAAVPVRISKSTAADEFFVDFAPLGRPSGWGFALHGTAWTVIFYGIGYSAAAPIVASDLDVTLLLLLNYTGTKLQFFMRGVQVGSDVVIAYPVPTVPSGPVFSIGRGTNTMLAQGFGYAGGSVAGGLTLAQVQQAFAEFDATGRTPTMQGLAQHRYDLTLDTLASGVDAVPAVVLDRVGSDHLTRVGGVSSAGGLVLAQRTERLWSYEATPILHGVQSLSVANFYTTAGIPTLVGSAAGFWVAVLLRIDSQAVASATRLAASTMSTAPNAGNAGGWYMQTTGTHSMIMFVPINVGGSGVSSPVSIVSASDVGKLLLVVGVHDGAKSRLYIKRAEQGTGSAISGYTPGTNPLNIGRDPRAILPADGLTVFGLAGGNGIPSLAEVQALHDAVLASEDIVAIPGRTDFLVSVKRDTLENGGVIPTQLKDRIGTDHMSKQGNPTLAPVFARAAGW